MKELFIFLIFIIITAYLGYPLLLLIFSWLSKNVVVKDDNHYPEVSMLIAAYNEEKEIAHKIENTLELDYPKDKLNIVVVSDGSTDNTDKIVKSYEFLGVKLFVVPGRVGKTEARNRAVLASKSEIILFSDATAIYDKNAIKRLVRNFADPSVGMVSGNLTYFDKTGGGIGIAAKVYWFYESLIKKAQSRLYTLTGAVGCINAFRRSLYQILPPNIIEDFTEPLMIVNQGFRVVYEQEAFSYERTTQKPSQEFTMRVRVIRGGMSGFLYASKRLLINRQGFILIQLFFHKVLRWLVPIFLILLFGASFYFFVVGSSFYVNLIFYIQIIFYLLAVVGLWFRPNSFLGKLTSIPVYFCVVNLASLMALYLTITSELEAAWETNIY